MSKYKRQIIPNRYRLLCLDAGSTMVKAAEYVDDEFHLISAEKSIDRLLSEINKYTSQNFDEILITGHKQWQDDLHKIEWPAGKSIFLDNSLLPARYLNYDTPSTLGLDRYLVCLGALETISKGDNGIVVIDAGSACTIDIMDANSIYNGGVIMPGLGIWENGFRQFTPQLPAVERKLPEEYPGKSTKTCLQWGLMGSFIAAVEYHQKQLEQKFGPCKIMITGGDGYDLVCQMNIPNSYYDSLLVFKGMIEFRKWFIEEPFGFE